MTSAARLDEGVCQPEDGTRIGHESYSRGHGECCALLGHTGDIIDYGVGELLGGRPALLVWET